MRVKTVKVTLYVEVPVEEDASDLACSTMEGGDWLLCGYPNMRVVDVDSDAPEVTDDGNPYNPWRTIRYEG